LIKKLPRCSFEEACPDSDIPTSGCPHKFRYRGIQSRPVTRADFRGGEWEDVLEEAYESNELPGEDLFNVWDDIDPGGGGHQGTEEEIEETYYLRAQTEKDE
jgi:hypothetical protein